MQTILITRTAAPRPKPEDESSLGFGRIFSDHMFLMDYDREHGWHDMRIEPYHAFSLEPSCVIFHYAQEVFEGLKAYRTPTDEIQLFRPDCNAARLQDSCDRLCIPPVSQEIFLEAVKTLVEIDHDWVPHQVGASLYIRPFIFACSNGLGVHAADRYTFCIITSPSGAYYAEGLKPVRIYVEDEYIRSAPGLTGFAKCGGNYAASIKSSEAAAQQGYAQVLWLDGIHHEYVEEVGSMNIFFKIDGRLYTAACTGTVLPGVTRRSVMELCRDWGLEVIEGRLSVQEIMDAAHAGRLEEVFGTGTAAVITPVRELYARGETIAVGDGSIGPLAAKLYDTLTGIQWGSLPDRKGWMVPVCRGH